MWLVAKSWWWGSYAMYIIFRDSIDRINLCICNHQVLHTTAAYLPDELEADEIAAFKDLVRAVPQLYPGKGRILATNILAGRDSQQPALSLLYTITLTPSFNSLQHTATHHTATQCNALQHTVTHCNTIQDTATHRNTQQHTAMHCSTHQ